MFRLYNSQRQANVEQCSGTYKVRTQWDPIKCAPYVNALNNFLLTSVPDPTNTQIITDICSKAQSHSINVSV